jgi:hypothetical protein
MEPFPEEARWPITQAETETFAVQIVENFNNLISGGTITVSGEAHIRELARMGVYGLIGHLDPPETIAVMNRVKEIMTGQHLVTQGNA